jgi:hypothetical protein
MHSPEDGLEGMSPVKLNEAASIAAEIIRSIQNKPLDWGRVPSSPVPTSPTAPSPEFHQKRGQAGEEGVAHDQ